MFSQIGKHVQSPGVYRLMKETRTTASPHITRVSGAYCMKMKSLDIAIEMIHQAIDMGEARWFGL